MPEIRALFWDVGGVLLTNAWDHEERDLAMEHFHLDRPSFESRHCELFTPFEEGKFTLDDYLNRAVFDQPRKFSREDFKQFMFSLSKPKPGAKICEVDRTDRKSPRLNSSHLVISYAVFCLKKKTTELSCCSSLR